MINEILVLVLPKKTNNRIHKQKFLLIDGITPDNLPLYTAFFYETKTKITLHFLGRVLKGFVDSETGLTQIEFSDFFQIPLNIEFSNRDKTKVPVRRLNFIDLFSENLEERFFIDKKLQLQADSTTVYFVNLTKEIIQELDLPPVIPLLEDDYKKFSNDSQGMLHVDAILRGIKFVLDFDPFSQYAGEYKKFYLDTIIEKALTIADSANINEALELIYSELKSDPENWELQNAMGLIYMKKNNMNKAIECFSKALKASPDNFEILKNTGACYYGLDNFDKALQIWKKARLTEEGSKDTDLAVTVGKTMLSQQKFKEAEKIFKWCLKINRDNRFARSYLGVVYASLKMPEKAIKTWKKVLEGSVFEPYTLVNLSRLYLIMGNYEKSFSTAFEVVFTSSKIEPDLRRMASQILDESEKKLQSDYQFKDPLKYKSFNRSFKRFRLFCMLYFKVKIKNISSLNSRTRKDIIDFIQNLKDSGLPLFFINFINDPEAPVEFKYLPLSMGAEMLVFKNEDLFGKLNNAPSLLEALGLKIIDDAGAKEPEIEKPEDHEDDLMQSVQENPDDPWAHYKLGVYFMDKKEYDKAIGFFDEVTRLSPENSMAYHAKGAALSKMGNYKEASAAFQRAIVSTPGDSLRDFFEKMNYKENIAYFDLGDTYAKMDMLDDAIKMFEKGLESDAKIPLAHFQLGVCYSSRLEHEKAVKSFENVIFLQPSFTPAYVRLGLSQMHLEKYDKAIKALTLATRVNPLDQEALVALGQAYLKKEEINMAIRCFGAAASVGPETDIGKAAKQKAQELLEGKI